MKNSIRPLVYGAIFFGLLAYLGYAVVNHGVASNAALNGFSALTAYGLIAVAIVSYAPAPKSHVRVSRVAPVVGQPEPVVARRPMVTIRRTPARSRVEGTGVLVS
ncbi:MAG TPA: hypothetical protein VGA56_15145 [Opitutaceae bacterium]